MIKLTNTEKLIMQAVCASPVAINGTAIAAQSGTKRNTVYALLARLEHKGAVTSQQVAAPDGHHVLQRVYLPTDAGRESCPLPEVTRQKLADDMQQAFVLLGLARPIRGVMVDRVRLSAAISKARLALMNGIKALEHVQ